MNVYISVIIVIVVSVVFVIQQLEIASLKEVAEKQRKFLIALTTIKNGDLYEKRYHQLLDICNEQETRIKILERNMKHQQESKDQIMKEVAQIREELNDKGKFYRLSTELSLEEFKQEAENYFNEKIDETYGTIDKAWGVDLALASLDQKEYIARRDEVRNAPTIERAYGVMFSSC